MKSPINTGSYIRITTIRDTYGKYYVERYNGGLIFKYIEIPQKETKRGI